MSDTRDDHERHEGHEGHASHDPTPDCSEATVGPVPDPAPPSELGAEPDPQLDPETDRFVRGLLADSRPDSPPPDHVVARLDQTLAGLVAEREEQGDVTDLAAVRGRRPRRLLVGLAAAAAVAVAAGVALPTLVGPDSDDRGSVASSDRHVTDLGQPGPVTLRAASAEEAVRAYVTGLDEPVATPAVTPLRSTPSDLQGSEGSEGSTDAQDPTTSADGSFRTRAGAQPTCEEPGEGEVHAATYDGRTALLVLSGYEDDSVLARVLVCDGDSGMNSGSPVVGEFVVPQP